MRAIHLSLAILLATALPAAAQTSSAVGTARRFLDAYAAGDTAVIDRMSEPGVTMYGSDIAEVAHGREELRAMLANDLKLWGGPAMIGPMSHLTALDDGRIAALAFDAPFRVSGGQPVMVRFSMVLRRHGREWRLAQSSNVTPSVGQSARELLGARR